MPWSPHTFTQSLQPRAYSVLLGSSIEKLDLSQNSIKDNGVAALAKGIIDGCVTEIKFQGNSSGEKLLDAMIKMKQGEKHIDVSSDGLGNASATALASALPWEQR